MMNAQRPVWVDVCHEDFIALLVETHERGEDVCGIQALALPLQDANVCVKTQAPRSSVWQIHCLTYQYMQFNVAFPVTETQRSKAPG